MIKKTITIYFIFVYIYCITGYSLFPLRWSYQLNELGRVAVMTMRNARWLNGCNSILNKLQAEFCMKNYYVTFQHKIMIFTHITGFPRSHGETVIAYRKYVAHGRKKDRKCPKDTYAIKYELIYTWTHTCVYKHVFICEKVCFLFLYIYLYIYTHPHTRIKTITSIHMYYVSVYAYLYENIYIYIYIYSHWNMVTYAFLYTETLTNVHTIKYATFLHIKETNTFLLSSTGQHIHQFIMLWHIYTLVDIDLHTHIEMHTKSCTQKLTLTYI